MYRFLRWLLGLDPTQPTNNTIATPMSAMNEGDFHSGPGGYEGMGYSGGYGADYFSDEDLVGGEEA
jgi:hypothetical protein